MKLGIFLIGAHAAAAKSFIPYEKSTEQMTQALGLNDFNICDYHQYDGYTKKDCEVDMGSVIQEYYAGDSAVSQMAGNLRSTPIRQRTTEQDKEYMQRFLQLKFTIKFLQQTKNFLRYCYYGCWCLPNGASDLGVGTGPPVDDIDRSCREFATCYSCLYNKEIGGTCEEKNPGRYIVRGRLDNNGRRYLVCMDPPNSCKRQRCECDVALSKKLQEYEGQWNVQNHRRLGNPPFSADQHCRIPVAESELALEAEAGSEVEGGLLSRLDTSAGSNAAGSVADNINSGKIAGASTVSSSAGGVTINRVVSSAPIYGAIIGCCGRAPNVHYFREGQKCCNDGEIVDFNAPCNMDFL